jgi:ABC-type Na+ efflux pump permease subunit
VRRLLPRLERLAEDLRQAGARDAGLGADALDALVVEARRDLAPQEDKAAFLLSFLLPMLMVMMTLSGAFYPAIDATAGERERGTHDTTLLLPVSRSTVLQGKILAVAALAMLATLLNVLAMGLSVGHLLGMLKGGGADLQFEVPWTAFVAIAPLALLFAFFVAATMMVFASRAKTFKEGQAALGPLQLFFYLPAMAGALPGLALTPALACVPVVNVVLAFRDLLKGRVAPLEYALAAVSLLVLALLAVRGATWFLQREEGGRPWFALRGGKAA